LATRLSNMAGSNVYGDGYVLGDVQVPYIAAGGMFRAKSSMYVTNPVYLRINSQMFTEWSLFGGFSFPLIPKYFLLGLSLKYANRSNAIVTEGLDPDELTSLFSSGSYTSIMKSGAGYSATLGAMITIPTGIPGFEPVLGLGWEDLGGLRFRNSAGNGPNLVKQSLNAGMALNYTIPYVGNLTIAADMRRLLQTNVQYPMKTHMGIRMKFPVVTTYLGINQGYFTAGVTFRMGFMELDAVSWAEEIGPRAGSYPDRIYFVRLRTGFEFETDKDGKGGEDSGFGGFMKRRR